MSNHAPHQSPAIAACAFEIHTSGKAIQLLPAGVFKARDGRPVDVRGGHWHINRDIAARLIAKASALATDLVVDYEHQTLNSADNGKPAPAAAWLKGASLEWREGVGLFATQVDWTPSAAAMIAAKEYRYLSPVFTYDRQTGAVTELLHVGLTNFPALDGLTELPALAAARFRVGGAQHCKTPAADELDAMTLEICRQLNVAPADYLATLRADRQQ